MARPTKYTEDMGPRAVALMSEGASKVEVCAELDIDYHTFQDYQELYPEFLQSVKTGELLSQAWWEKHGRTCLRDKEFNPTLWYMNMKNRFGWADKQETKTEHSGEVKIEKIERVIVDPKA